MTEDTRNNNEIGYGKPPPGFKKGDPRINRKGRPKSFDAWRKLLQSVMNEPATGPDGKPIVKTINGKEHIVTNAEMFAEAWMKSKDRKGFAEHAYGKPKDEIDLSNSDGSLTTPPLPDEERLARMKQLAVMIADEVKKINA